MNNKISLDGDINNLKQTEVRKIAVLMNKANKACWDAIGYVSELNNILNKLDKEEHSELFRRIAETFLKLCRDTRLIDMDDYGAETQQYTEYAHIINDILEEIE